MILNCVRPDSSASRSGPAARSPLSGYVGAMTNAFGVVLDSASVRWAAAEGVPETVIAVCLLHERSVDEIAAKLVPGELEQVIKLVGRSPSSYPPGTLDASKAGDTRWRRSRLQAFPTVEWRPLGPLHGSSPTLSTCAGPMSTGSLGSVSAPLRALRLGFSASAAGRSDENRRPNRMGRASPERRSGLRAGKRTASQPPSVLLCNIQT
jgi:hypothetical protein